MNRFEELESISQMGRHQRIEKFFGAYFELIELGIKRVPAQVRPLARIWIQSASSLMCSDSVSRALDLSLSTYGEKGGHQRAVELVLDEELIAVLAQIFDVQDRMDAAEKSDAALADNNLEGDEKPIKWSMRRLFGDWWRGGEAAHSLVGSWSEVLKDVLPDWLRGGLKVAQEGWEIYGRVRRPKN
jgi:hypothetical protein